MIGRAFVLAAILLVVPVPGNARDRIDFFDAKGRRQGYAVIDRKTGHVDFYDAQSRRTGFGRITDGGKLERFDTKGRRQELIAPPVPAPRR